MAQVARKVRDKRLLKLIGRFLRAGVMVDGLLPTDRERNHARRSAVSPVVEYLSG